MTLILSLLISLISAFFLPHVTFDINQGMAISESYIKKMDIHEKNFLSHIHYSKKTKKAFFEKKDSDLLGIRCTDGIIRTFQGVYLLENTKAANREKMRIKNTEFVNLMREKEPTLTQNRRILSSRVCEFENKSRVIFYTVGTYNTRDADFQSPRLTVLNSKDNIAYLDFIPSIFTFGGKITYKLAESENHTRCDRLFFVDKKNVILLLCEEKLDYASVFTTLMVDLNNGSFKTIEKCKNDYKNGLVTKCN